ncbi:hypothetical protein CLOBY_01070 [Clostridium saccharobutylicum]|uniref:hypothetical protein n=1 Tax=Clostridium saccharobutylicum TaxID=169679 RepID=UPI000983EC46|nr:hypothetical protein [Clostridium saccharobutylicum]AQS08058.1 hypothetical protein CLOBY_01070 [Clostridium saccharobutylicum]MBC2437034.1 hypothetical protein [Clostridium saccharobutylicum]NSB89386.1 hypothetical protein [Clostridium saccharobutylicum]NYC29621.1 hypothetical protein [Clostridium saccharobutylicum]OOM17389.1 hypothetical protein CLSAB_18140 [Clostridium saccharobutylicum]
MVIKIINVDTYRYQYRKRKPYNNFKRIKRKSSLFVDILNDIEKLKDDGIITIDNINIKIDQAIKSHSKK